MLSALHSKIMPENSSRSISAPALFAAFPPALQTQLRESAIRKSFHDGQFLYHRGESADGFWLIDSGQVKIGYFSDSGDMQVIAIIGPGDSFGELACFGQFVRVVDAQAMGRVEGLWISDAQLTRAMATSPDVTRELMRILATQLQEALNNMFFFRNMSATQRLAQRLLALGAGRAPPFRLTIRQQELAELIGVSRMTIASSLAELEKAGFIARHYRYIVISDAAGLQAWMERRTSA
jgi:CRP/FNR family transcriptional regulator, cyclic AMP receptor protein